MTDIHNTQSTENTQPTQVFQGNQGLQGTDNLQGAQVGGSAQGLQNPQGAQNIQNIQSTAPDGLSMQEIHDIEPPIQVGMDPFIIKMAMLTAAALIIALLVFFLFRYIRNRKRKQAGGDILLLPPPLPPGEAALRELDAIMAIMQSHPRLYYFRLTALLKTFIGKCFNIHAPEMTTQEIITALNAISLGNPFHRELFSSAKKLFDTSSMIKYAAVVPSLDQMRADEDFTRRFIDAVHNHITTSDNGTSKEAQGGQ